METFIGSGSALTVYDLLPADGACYHWRMRAQEGNTWGAYGPAATFCTSSAADPATPTAEKPAIEPADAPAKRPTVNPKGAPLPQAPIDGEPADASALTFEWTPVEGAAGYRLQVAPSDAFGEVLIDLPLAATDALTVYGLLPPGTAYYWRVRARVGDEERPWSRPAAFHAASDDEVEAYTREQADADRAARRSAERAAEAAPQTDDGSWKTGYTPSSFAIGWAAFMLVSFVLTMLAIALVVPGA